MDLPIRIIKLLLIVCFIGWAGTFFVMKRLPPNEMIRPQLLQQPGQTELPRENFTIRYKEQDVIINQLAEYTMYGLVVSHNDPEIWYNFDISHDEKSLNTRDVCVAWGKNLQNDEFRSIDFKNDDNFCLYTYDHQIEQFNEHEVANNHLITDNDEIRERIANIKVGDQIYIRGKLANYKEDRMPTFRLSSMVRSDTGDGSCEIIFVQDLQIVHSYNKLWHILHEVCFYTFWVGLVGLIFIFWKFPAL